MTPDGPSRREVLKSTPALYSAAAGSYLELGQRVIYIDPEFCSVNSRSADPSSLRLWLAHESPLRTVSDYSGQSPNQSSVVPSCDIDGRPRPGPTEFWLDLTRQNEFTLPIATAANQLEEGAPMSPTVHSIPEPSALVTLLSALAAAAVTVRPRR